MIMAFWDFLQYLSALCLFLTIVLKIRNMFVFTKICKSGPIYCSFLFQFVFQFEPPVAVIDVGLLINTFRTQHEKLHFGDDTLQNSCLTTITDYSLVQFVQMHFTSCRRVFQGKIKGRHEDINRWIQQAQTGLL
ncbi:hypothetical protein XENORESO_019378 [Xenotaenia resolanae]|uniref:Uncharacterized protein n=1 Tax=Xenotaenia resolanae TaxID=208358 RepID=A0ABV0X5A4_9TELE